LLRNLGEVEDKRCQLFEPKRRVLTSPGGSLRFVKKRFRLREKGFRQQSVKTYHARMKVLTESPSVDRANFYNPLIANHNTLCQR
jgi:hypothetical protein